MEKNSNVSVRLPVSTNKAPAQVTKSQCSVVPLKAQIFSDQLYGVNGTHKFTFIFGKLIDTPCTFQSLSAAWQSSWWVDHPSTFRTTVPGTPQTSNSATCASEKCSISENKLFSINKSSIWRLYWVFHCCEKIFVECSIFVKNCCQISSKTFRAPETKRKEPERDPVLLAQILHASGELFKQAPHRFALLQIFLQFIRQRKIWTLQLKVLAVASAREDDQMFQCPESWSQRWWLSRSVVLSRGRGRRAFWSKCFLLFLCSAGEENVEWSKLTMWTRQLISVESARPSMSRCQENWGLAHLSGTHSDHNKQMMTTMTTAGYLSRAD